MKSVFLVQDTPSLHDLGDAEFSLVLHEVLFHLFATRANALARGTFLFWSDSRLLQNALNVFLGVMWSPEKFWLKRYRWDPLLVIFWLVPVVKHACRNWSSPAMRSCQLVSQALGEGLKMAGTSRR